MAIEQQNNDYDLAAGADVYTKTAAAAGEYKFRLRIGDGTLDLHTDAASLGVRVTVGGQTVGGGLQYFAKDAAISRAQISVGPYEVANGETVNIYLLSNNANDGSVDVTVDPERVADVDTDEIRTSLGLAEGQDVAHDGGDVNLTAINGTSIAGTSTYVAAAFLAQYNVATPVFTNESVNQTGDAFATAEYAASSAMAARIAAETVEAIVKSGGPGDLAAIKTQTDKFSFTGTDVKATLDGEEVTPTTASKTGYALTSEERTAIAAAIEADLIDDETHEAVMAAILAKLEAGFPDLDTLTLTAIASQVRTELATELARIDATISSRHAAGAAVAKSPATLDWSADVSNPPTIGDATAANQTTMLNRIGTFTGTGINTILGFFKALMSKAADTPTDIGGTFSPATDSVEAIRDTPPIGTEMRGTDGANTVVPPTVEAVAAQLERDGGPLLVTAETVVENLDAKVSLAGQPAGEGSVDLIITCSAGGVPQDGVAVWLYLDDQYSQIAHGPLYSNAHGTVVFHVDPPAPYYAKLQRGGLNFPNQTLVWNEDEQRYETE